MISKDIGVVVYDESPALPTGSVQDLLPSVYKKRACLADAVVVGRPQKSVDHLSSSGTSVYADYDFQVTRRLKDNSKSPTRVLSDVVVTRLGGSYRFEEGKVVFEVEFSPRLSEGQLYLMFLRYVPGSNSYAALDDMSTLVLSQDKWKIDRKAYIDMSAPILASPAFEEHLAEP